MHLTLKPIWNIIKNFDYSKIPAAIGKFVVKNEDILAKGACAIGVGAVAKKCNIPLPGPFDGYNTSPDSVVDFNEWKYRDNPKGAAITAVYKNAVRASWDDDKIRGIKTIRDLVLSSENITDEISSYAINCIRRIADSSRWSDVKTRANDAIVAIGKRG